MDLRMATAPRSDTEDQKPQKSNAKCQIPGYMPCDTTILPITGAIEYGEECSCEGGKEPTGNLGPLGRLSPSENPLSAGGVAL